MPAQVTTRAQVNGYRFILRRLEHALIRGDSRMIHDPMRGQTRALTVGVVIAVLIAGAMGVLAFFKPAPDFGNSSVLLSKSNGAMFVKVGDRLHPVMNLASARLIVGKSEPLREVDDKFLNTVARGPMLGIVGAPAALSASDDTANSSWTVCDSKAPAAPSDLAAVASTETTVLANVPALGRDIMTAAPGQMVLTRSGDASYLLYEGVRAQVDESDPVMRNALRLDDASARDVSPGLLNAFPLVDPIVPVTIPRAGQSVTYMPGALRVGAIVQTADSRGEQLYVALVDGLQPISVATADVITYSNAFTSTVSDAVKVSPSVVSSAPVVHDLAVDHYPAASPDFTSGNSATVLCAAWNKSSSTSNARVGLLLGQRLPIPSGASPVGLASADGAGPDLDQAYVTPGSGEYVRATGGAPDSESAGELFYINDLGLRFHVGGNTAAAALGLVGTTEPGTTDLMPQAAPWPILSLLPPGPELTQQAALIAHDGYTPDANGTAFAPPKH